jgi:hypothetical protein
MITVAPLTSNADPQSVTWKVKVKVKVKVIISLLSKEELSKLGMSG